MYIHNSSYPPPYRINRLAVRLVGSLGDDTRVDQVDVAPVLALSTLAIDLSSGVGDGVPESSTRDILVPSVTLRIEEALAGVQSVVEHSLERPFTDENRELGLVAGDVGALAAYGGVDVVGVGTGGSEIVDVRVEDDVGGGVVEGGPVRGTHEAVLDHHRDALILFIESQYLSLRLD
jgi:hypothetical protein